MGAAGRCRAAHERAAASIFGACGQRLEMLWAEENLGEIAYARGDLPGALAVLDQVAPSLRRPRSSSGPPRDQGAVPGLPGCRAGGGGDRRGRGRRCRAGSIAPVRTGRSWSCWGATARLDSRDLTGAVVRGHLRAGERWDASATSRSETRARLVAVRARTRAVHAVDGWPPRPRAVADESSTRRARTRRRSRSSSPHGSRTARPRPVSWCARRHIGPVVPTSSARQRLAGPKSAARARGRPRGRPAGLRAWPGRAR